MRIEALANDVFAKLPEKLLQFIRGESGIDFALVDINADFGRIAAGDDGVEIGRELDSSTDFFIDDLLSVVGSCRHDFDVWQRAQGAQNPRRVLSSYDHDRRNLQKGPADQARR